MNIANFIDSLLKLDGFHSFRILPPYAESGSIPLEITVSESVKGAKPQFQRYQLLVSEYSLRKAIKTDDTHSLDRFIEMEFETFFRNNLPTEPQGPPLAVKHIADAIEDALYDATFPYGPRREENLSYRSIFPMTLIPPKRIEKETR